jgi:RimJ/RimL family protein N-acetyltransferase
MALLEEMAAGAPGEVTLCGATTRLRPMRPEDLELLYGMATDGPTGFRWRYRGAVPDRTEFVRDLANGVLVQFMVERRATRQPVGMVSAYGASQRDGWAYLAAVSHPTFRRSGAVVDGLATLTDYLFAGWPFRKLYLEVLGYNTGQFGSVLHAVAEEEGRLRGHVFHAGRYWDVVTAAIYRERWQAYRAEASRSAARVGDETIDFESFCSLLADRFDLSPGLHGSMRLVDDLAFDSLMMMELGALVADLLGDVDFEMLGEIATVADAYGWYCTGASMPEAVHR